MVGRRVGLGASRARRGPSSRVGRARAAISPPRRRASSTSAGCGPITGIFEGEAACACETRYGRAAIRGAGARGAGRAPRRRSRPRRGGPVNSSGMPCARPSTCTVGSSARLVTGRRGRGVDAEAVSPGRREICPGGRSAGATWLVRTGSARARASGVGRGVGVGGAAGVGSGVAPGVASGLDRPARAAPVPALARLIEHAGPERHQRAAGAAAIADHAALVRHHRPLSEHRLRRGAVQRRDGREMRCCGPSAAGGRVVSTPPSTQAPDHPDGVEDPERALLDDVRQPGLPSNRRSSGAIWLGCMPAIAGRGSGTGR